MSININQKAKSLGKQAAVMVNRLPISQARVNLGQVAKRAHVGGEYFILEKDGIPVIGIMDAVEMEDYLELRDRNVIQQIEQSNADIKAGRVRPAASLLSAASTRTKGRRSPKK
jgi:hypothetical protein